MLGQRTSSGALVTGLMLALLVLSAAPLQAAPPKDETGFTAYLLRKLAAGMPTAKLRVEAPLVIEIRYDSGALGHVLLKAIWQFCATSKVSDCEHNVDRVVAETISAPPSDPTSAVAAVRAVLRTVASIEYYQRNVASPGEMLVTAPFAGDLRILCVIDQPTTLSYLTLAGLKRLRLSADEAIALGIRNVAATLRPLPEVMMGTPVEAFGYSVGDDYESGRVMLHDDLAELSGAWEDKLIVAVPETHLVLYADGRRPDAIPAMRAAVREGMARADRPISATLFHWTKTGWEVIPP